jgi:hypothetical protein
MTCFIAPQGKLSPSKVLKKGYLENAKDEYSPFFASSHIIPLPIKKKKKKKKKLQYILKWHTPLIPALGRQRQVDF